MISNIINKLKLFLLKKYFFMTYNVIVFESDDWGFANIYDKKKYDSIKKFIINFNSPYAYFCLEDEKDLNRLEKVLENFKDITSYNFQMTANFIVQQPNFKLIIKSGYKKLFFKNLDISIYKNIIKKNIFLHSFMVDIILIF